MGNRISDCSDGSDSQSSGEETEALSSSVLEASENAPESFLCRQDGGAARDSSSRLRLPIISHADNAREQVTQNFGAHDVDDHGHSDSISSGAAWSSSGCFPAINDRDAGNSRKWRTEFVESESQSPSSYAAFDNLAPDNALASGRCWSSQTSQAAHRTQRAQTPERRPADDASLPRRGGRCEEVMWGSDDHDFFSPTSRPTHRKHGTGRERVVRPQVGLETPRIRSIDEGDERLTERHGSSSFSSSGEKTEEEVTHCPVNRSHGIHEPSSYDQRPILGGCLPFSSWRDEQTNVRFRGSERTYATAHPVPLQAGERGRKRTRQMRLEEEWVQHLERGSQEPEEGLTRARDVEDTSRRQTHWFHRRQNAAYSSGRPDGSHRYPSRSLPSSQASAREKDTFGTGSSLSSYSHDAAGTGRGVREVCEEKDWADDQVVTSMSGSPSGRSGTNRSGSGSQTRAYPFLSPEKGVIYSTRRGIGLSGLREGEMETPPPSHSLRSSPRKREEWVVEDGTSVLSPRIHKQRRGPPHDEAADASGSLATENQRREEAAEEGPLSRELCSRNRDSANSLRKPSLYAHVQHRVPSHRVRSSAGRRTTAGDSSESRKETDFLPFDASSSGDALDESRHRSGSMRAETMQVREHDCLPPSTENKLEMTAREARDSLHGGESRRPLEEWTEKLEGALQPLMTQQRTTRLAQNTWKLHGKEVSLGEGKAFCLCEEVFGRDRETLAAFFSRRDAAWLLPASQFGDKDACSGKDYERLKTSSLQCIHCRVRVHALCGAVASRFPRLPKRFYCCLCRILLFDPSAEVTWCSSIASLACPAYHLSDEDLAGPPALIPSLAGRCVLPFSHSPVLQRELASNPSAALELRFFPMDDPVCGRHRPYIPDRLQIFFNPRVRALTAGSDITPVSLRKRSGGREAKGGIDDRDGFISYSFSESSSTGPGRGGNVMPTLRTSPRKCKIGVGATRTAVAGFDCSAPDFETLYDPVVPHLHPKPPLYLSDIKRHARPKSGMNYVVARGQHREGRLFLVQLVCSLPVEESQLLEAIVQRRSLPIPYCTDFLKWIVAQKTQRRVSTSSDEVEIFDDSHGQNRISGGGKDSIMESPRSRRCSMSSSTLKGHRDICGSANVRNEDLRDGALNHSNQVTETPRRGFWSVIFERLPGFKRKKTVASPQVSTTASASQSALPPVLTLTLFSDDIAGRLRTPVRSVHCRHPECFDLQFYVRTNYLRHCARSSWKCPLCEEYAFPHELYVDTLVQEILHMTDFSPPKRKAKTVSFHSPDLEKYVVEEWCDDDYEDLSMELSGW
ncbi:MIZ/SP-RING zinc finger domain-containing protein [Toxoplasma gondii TgCatPRC2]|uniref:MIZ/SP-RING zinc finger domain-containing protein n=1 Tax=Toxoplasma gondii TgCatPRC2 TaxID=1130821 RepID=A0A151GZ58_TOXGO|nr:MIZ/SP-RING zinc finger domain-containing protein [Toxoplasma gondii TgCatPRC2]